MLMFPLMADFIAFCSELNLSAQHFYFPSVMCSVKSSGLFPSYKLSGQKVYPGKQHIPIYTNMETPPPPKKAKKFDLISPSLQFPFLTILGTHWLMLRGAMEFSKIISLPPKLLPLC